MDVFHVFLNCTNGTKLRKASHMHSIFLKGRFSFENCKFDQYERFQNDPKKSSGYT